MEQKIVPDSGTVDPTFSPMGEMIQNVSRASGGERSKIFGWRRSQFWGRGYERIFKSWDCLLNILRRWRETVDTSSRDFKIIIQIFNPNHTNI